MYVYIFLHIYIYIFIIIYIHITRKRLRIRILRYDTRIYIFVFVSQYLRYITAPYNVSCITHNPVVIEGIFVPVSTISFKLARNWIHPLSILYIVYIEVCVSEIVDLFNSAVFLR